MLPGPRRRAPRRRPARRPSTNTALIALVVLATLSASLQLVGELRGARGAGQQVATRTGRDDGAGPVAGRDPDRGADESVDRTRGASWHATRPDDSRVGEYAAEVVGTALALSDDERATYLRMSTTPEGRPGVSSGLSDWQGHLLHAWGLDDPAGIEVEVQGYRVTARAVHGAGTLSRVVLFVSTSAPAGARAGRRELRAVVGVRVADDVDGLELDAVGPPGWVRGRVDAVPGLFYSPVNDPDGGSS